MAGRARWRRESWRLYRDGGFTSNRYGTIALTDRIYLDHAATTPMRPEARAAVIEGMARWANPSSPHAEGRAARRVLEDARERIRAALDWPGEVILTSGASEAIGSALRGRSDVAVSAVEHDAVLRAAPDARRLPVGRRAEVDRDALADALAAGCTRVAVQHVNSETGVTQPIADMSAQVRAAGGVLVADCSQSAARYRLPDCDVAIVSAHKLGGPPGIGALLVRDFAMLRPSGGQEFGYRGGTENLPGALGFAAALEARAMGQGGTVQWMEDLRPAINDLTDALLAAGATFQPVAGDALFDPGIRSITMPGVPASAQLIRFDAAGIAVSAGSACSSGTLKTSAALAAFGVAEADARCTIRVSFGWSSIAEEIARFQAAWLHIAQSAGSRAA